MSADSAESPVRVRVEGILYGIQIESNHAMLDWLDKTLLSVTRVPRRVDELMRTLPLPSRLLEDALARLLEWKRLLIDVTTGKVSATDLEVDAPATSLAFFHAWQDNVTGLIVPWGEVKQWAWDPSASEGGEEIVLEGGPPERTPLQMSDAELLHEIRYYRREAEANDRVRFCERQSRKALDLKAYRRADGRLAIAEDLPWRLRSRWARLGQISAAGREAEDSIDVVLPSKWVTGIVGRWSEGVHKRIQREAVPWDATEGALRTITRTLGFGLRVRFGGSGAQLVQSLAANARKSVVAVVSRTQLGLALQVLKRAPDEIERVLVVHGGVPEKRRAGIEEQFQLCSLPEADEPVCQFVVADGQGWALGGLGNQPAFLVSANRELPGPRMWMASQVKGLELRRLAKRHGRTLPRDVAELVEDIESFELNLREFRFAEMREQGEATALPPSLQERHRRLETELLARRVRAFSWVSAEDVLGLLQDWDAPRRIVVRSRECPLVTASAQHDCVLWPDESGPGECVVLDEIVLLGSWHGDASTTPEFLAVHDPDLAVELRTLTSGYEPVGSPNEAI